MRKRDALCQFWLTKEEAAAFDELVKKSGLTRSAYLRFLIRGIVPIELPPPDYYTFVRELHGIGNNLNQIAQKAHVLGVIDADRYTDTAKKMEERTLQIMEAVISHKEMDRWQPPRSGA